MTCPDNPNLNRVIIIEAIALKDLPAFIGYHMLDFLREVAVKGSSGKVLAVTGAVNAHGYEKLSRQDKDELFRSKIANLTSNDYGDIYTLINEIEYGNSGSGPETYI